MYIFNDSINCNFIIKKEIGGSNIKVYVSVEGW